VLSRVRSKLTYANVMATVAVFLALGGGIAWALANNSVKSKHIKDGQVKTDDLSDDVETQGFTYSAATGDALQEEILDTRGYRVLAACDSVSGRPSLALFFEFPEDGRIQGFGILDPSNGAGNPGAGTGSDVDGGVPFDGGSLEAPASEAMVQGNTIWYIGQSEAALLNLHLLADDDDDGCRVAGTLTPGIIPPA
jgi:hypothetical protein